MQAAPLRLNEKHLQNEISTIIKKTEKSTRNGYAAASPTNLQINDDYHSRETRSSSKEERIFTIHMEIDQCK